MSMNRVWVVYRKEMLDVLRDRRTLLAMIVVPVVLYPVVLIIGMQAFQLERGNLEKERFRVAVADQAQKAWVAGLLAEEQESASQPGSAPHEENERLSLRGEQFDIVVVSGSTDQAVADRRADVALRIVSDAASKPDDAPETVTLAYNPAEYRSNVARAGIEIILTHAVDRQVLSRLMAKGLPASVLEPIKIKTKSVATPQEMGGAVLGNFLPFLLVIMTVSGAVYPAIDLTVGERERATLETLMTAPVPITQVMIGKFLVVASIAMLTSLLNLLSMAATLWMTGITEAITKLQPAMSRAIVPVSVLPLVLLALVPFTVLFSAVMLAVCSFARSFKEAQNYMMPVILVAMIPALSVVLSPSLKLTPMMAVVPVANVVLMLRELFIGNYQPAAMAIAFLVTCIYAAAGVLAAARVYGQEAVLFNDVGSYRVLLNRRFIKPSDSPGPALAIILVALLFPLSFYWQSAMGAADISQARLIALVLSTMIGVLLVPVTLATWFFKLDWRNTFSIRMPGALAVAGTVFIALGITVVHTALSHLQQYFFPPSPEMVEALGRQTQMFLDLGLPLALLLVAALPAVCEELLFRGFLQSGLRGHLKPAMLCIVVGVIFGLFHMDVGRIPTTALLGAMLAYVCWASRSILPGIIIHMVNNGTAIVAADVAQKADGKPTWADQLGITNLAPPAWLIIVTSLLVLIGLVLLHLDRTRREQTATA